MSSFTIIHHELCTLNAHKFYYLKYAKATPSNCMLQIIPKANLVVVVVEFLKDGHG